MTLQTRLAPEHGQTMAEYALVVSVITVGVVTALGLFSNTVANAIKTVAGLIPT